MPCFSSSLHLQQDRHTTKSHEDPHLPLIHHACWLLHVLQLLLAIGYLGGYLGGRQMWALFPYARQAPHALQLLLHLLCSPRYTLRWTLLPQALLRVFSPGALLLLPGGQVGPGHWRIQQLDGAAGGGAGSNSCLALVSSPAVCSGLCGA